MRPSDAAEAKKYGIIDAMVGQTGATAAADRAEAAVQEESRETSPRTDQRQNEIAHGRGA
jgi:hypothetical protein